MTTTMTLNGLDERRRTQEEDYFRRQEERLKENLRRRIAEEEERRRLSAATGITDAVLLGELRAAGFTAETAEALSLAPFVEVAWAEGRVQGGERKTILEIAGERGIDPGHPAHARVTAWLDERPASWLYELSLKFMRARLDAFTPRERGRQTREVLAGCARVARSAGGAGFVPFGDRVSGEERRIIERLMEDLELEEPAAVGC